MPKVDVYNIKGEVVGDIYLSDDIFGVEVNTDAMHTAVVNHLPTHVRERNQPRPEVKYGAVAESRGGRKVQVVPVRVVSVPFSGKAAVWLLLRNREVIVTQFPRN